MLDLESAIKHCEEVAEEHTKYNRYGGFESCDEYAKEHRQLAEWLKELKQLREQTEWIPCSEKLPEMPFGCLVTVEEDDRNGEPQNVLYSEPVGYDGETWNRADGELISFEVVAWMPLPEPYVTDINDGKLSEVSTGSDSQGSEKINCKTTKCENCKNHNYCDYESQESEDEK